MRAAAVICLLLLTACTSDVPEPNGEASQPHPEYFDAAVPVSLQDVFYEPDRAVLFTVVSSGEIEVLNEPALKESEKIGSWFVYDQLLLNTEETASLTSTFEQATMHGEYNGMMCFVPHHVLRLEKGGRTLNLIVCFNCRNFKVLPEGGRNNVVFSKGIGVEEAWRKVVADHKLRDYSIEHPDEIRQ